MENHQVALALASHDEIPTLTGGWCCPTKSSAMLCTREMHAAMRCWLSAYGPCVRPCSRCLSPIDLICHPNDFALCEIAFINTRGVYVCIQRDLPSIGIGTPGN